MLGFEALAVQQRGRASFAKPNPSCLEDVLLFLVLALLHPSTVRCSAHHSAATI
jgi:hypothetical protein